MEIPTPWWAELDQYDDASATSGLENVGGLWGPEGAALVRLWDSGQTSRNWGEKEFMASYLKKEFNSRKILFGYERGAWAYAWVMRSANLVCIDIDGKNGGIENASKLGWLPPTRAEISKSGNGFHLFYRTIDDWHLQEGFASYRDHIGLFPGIDIRGTGCVYHYPQQRWNRTDLEILPTHLAETLRAKAINKRLSTENILKRLELDPDEVAIMQDEILAELAQTIPIGRRNNTLFAIGSKMCLAAIENWEDLIQKRAEEVALNAQEIEKLLRNIKVYGQT